MESTRAKEKEIKKETTAQLDAFRKQQQDDAEKAAKLQDGEAAPEVAETWTVGPRKRKKGKESLIGGVKVRRTSSTAERAGHTSPPPAPASPVDDSVAGQTLAPKVDSYGSKESSAEVKRTETSPPTSPKPAAQGLGLAAYSSDEDD